MKLPKVMIGTKVGVFEVLAAGASTMEQVAKKIGTNARATEKLLNGLVAAGYLRHEGGRYRLARMARKWLLKDTPERTGVTPAPK